MAKETTKIGITQLIGGIFIFFAIFIISQWYGFTGTNGTHSYEFVSIFSAPKMNYSSGETKENYVLKLNDNKYIQNFTNYISQVYEMKGDIRINGKSSEVLFLTTNISEPSALSDLKNETWTLKPYAFKFKSFASFVNDVSVKVLEYSEKAPACSVNGSSIPAVVFSNGGYCGNFYHDINDVLVPMYLTSYKFNGEVQFLVMQKQGYWFRKYRKVISQLTNYEVIDLDNEEKIHCYNHVIVGHHGHDDFKIDPKIDYRKFFRNAYGLKRDFPIHIGNNNNDEKKPRVLIIERKKTRELTNTDEITSMISELGFEVVVNDLINQGDASEPSKIINSCDIMIGVHGAALTNMMFLPNNAVLIQIIPVGDYNDLLTNVYKLPALNMKLNYLQYDISEEESTLINLYRRNDSVFTDVKSIHDQGWGAIKEIYLGGQNITINVTRFRPLMEKAMKLLSA